MLATSAFALSPVAVANRSLTVHDPHRAEFTFRDSSRFLCASRGRLLSRPFHKYDGVLPPDTRLLSEPRPQGAVFTEYETAFLKALYLVDGERVPAQEGGFNRG
jgi:hypothetical protein